MKRKIILENFNIFEQYSAQLLQICPGWPTKVFLQDLNVEQREQIESLLMKLYISLHYRNAAFGWCVCEDHTDKTPMSMIVNKVSKEIRNTSIESDSDIDNLDTRVSSIISDEDVGYIASKILLSDKDREKIKRAVFFFQQGDFYTCSFYLATLIDSQNIKTEVSYHKQQEDNKKSSQCWRSFVKIIDYYFENLLVDKKLSEAMTQSNRREAFEQLIEKINYNQYSVFDTPVPLVIETGYALLNFFDNTDWSDYLTTRPAYFNRNWLCHGMYDIEDINRVDCVQLFFLLYSVNKLFSCIAST